MGELEEKLGAVLNDPQMMQQIFTMAQTLGSQPTVSAQESTASEPGLDPGMLQKLAGMVRQGNMEPNQQALLSALSPYLSTARIGKLERAMKAARLAGAASTFLNAGGLQMLTGR